MLGYCIATPYWRASTPVISDNIEITEVCVQTNNSADNKLTGANSRNPVSNNKIIPKLERIFAFLFFTSAAQDKQHVV